MTDVRKVAEAHLFLGGMDIEVHQRRIDLHEDEGRGEPATRNETRETVLGSLQEPELRDAAAVDERLQEFPVTPADLGITGNHRDGKPLPFRGALAEHPAVEERAVDRRNPFDQPRRGIRGFQVAVS